MVRQTHGQKRVKQAKESLRQASGSEPEFLPNHLHTILALSFLAGLTAGGTNTHSSRLASMLLGLALDNW